MVTPFDGILREVQTYGQREYEHGFGKGIEVAEKILIWATTSDPPLDQSILAEWGKKEIDKARLACLRPKKT